MPTDSSGHGSVRSKRLVLLSRGVAGEALASSHSCSLAVKEGKLATLTPGIVTTLRLATPMLPMNLTPSSRKLTVESIKLTSKSTKVTDESIKLTYQSIKLTVKSIKLTSESIKLTFASTKLTM